MAMRIVPHTPAIDIASAELLVPDLAKLVEGLRGRTEPAIQIRLEALAAGLGPILASVAASDDEAEIDAPVRQARALLEMLEDALPPGPTLDEGVPRSIARIQALLGVPADQRAFIEDEEQPADDDDVVTADEAALAAYRAETMMGIVFHELCNAKTNDAAQAIDRLFACLHAIEGDFGTMSSFIKAEENRRLPRNASAAREALHV